MPRYATVSVHEECGKPVEIKRLPATTLDPAVEHMHCPACGREVSEEECSTETLPIWTADDFRYVDD